MSSAFACAIASVKTCLNCWCKYLPHTFLLPLAYRAINTGYIWHADRYNKLLTNTSLLVCRQFIADVARAEVASHCVDANVIAFMIIAQAFVDICIGAWTRPHITKWWMNTKKKGSNRYVFLKVFNDVCSTQPATTTTIKPICVY